MSINKFTFLRESIDRYQNHSNRLLKRLELQLPHHIDSIACAMENSSIAFFRNKGSQTRCLAETSADVAEAILLSNDYACDLVLEAIAKVEQKTFPS